MKLPDIPKSTNPRVPEPEYPFRHETPAQLRFNDFDMLGHLNNSIYVTLLDLGKSHYFTDVMPSRIDWKRVNIVVVNINCDFLAPTYLSEPIVVLTQVVSISERSFKMQQRVVNANTGEVKCIGTTVMAGFDPATTRGIPISQEWIDALCAHEGRDLRVTNNNQPKK